MGLDSSALDLIYIFKEWYIYLSNRLLQHQKLINPDQIFLASLGYSDSIFPSAIGHLQIENFLILPRCR